MDEPRSWIVLIAAQITYMFALGIVASYGVYFAVFREYFNISLSQAAVVTSIMYWFISGTAPISSFLYRRYGSRRTVMFGGVLTSSGFLTCYFTQSFVQVAIAHGIIGFGLGMVTVPMWSVPTEYFNKFRNLAMGILATGAGCGIFLFPRLFVYCIDQYTWRGSMLINAGVTLHLVVCGALMTPSKSSKNIHSRKHTYCQLFKTDKIFLFAIGCLCWAGSGQVFYQMMPTFAWHNNVKRTDIVWITSAVGLTDICARLLAALLNHTLVKDHTVFLYALAVFLDALSIFTLTLCSNLMTFVADGMFFGFSFGLMMGSHGASAFDIFGFQQFPDAIGVGLFAASIGGLSIPLIAGVLGDKYGIVWTFRFAAVVAATGSINVFALAVRKRLTSSPVDHNLQSKRRNFQRTASMTLQTL